MNLKSITFLLALAAALPAAALAASDLDDGIAMDDPIADDIQKDVNVEFIVAKAVGRANAKSNRARSAADGAGNINFAPGAKIGNNVIIINKSTNKNVDIVDQ
jgi:hypothetical protein